MIMRYFDTCWDDLRNSPGWKGKVCLLALLNMIPVFGQIVTFGYAYGWAREAAWGMRNPLPRSIFENSDGMFWRRGWFSCVIAVAWSIVPGIITFAGSIMYEIGMGFEPLTYSSVATSQFNPSLFASGLALYFVGLCLSAFATVLSWVGCIRSAIYNKLKPGFQIGKIWKMARRDGFGLFKIFGMQLILYFATSMAISFAVLSVALITIIPLTCAIQANGSMAAPLTIALVWLIVVLLLTYVFVALVALMFQNLMVARAIGYWTLQFNVARWGRPNDPLPFEVDPQLRPQPSFEGNDPRVR